MEYGGYVEPPAHIKKSNKAPLTGLPAEQRPVPDYDYSLFRYSGTAVGFLLLIIASAAVLQALTWWQGPWGFERGVNGASDGVPRGINLKHVHGDAGVKNHVRNLRWASFVIGVLAVAIVAFSIRAQPQPGALRALLIIGAILAFCVFVLDAVAFGLSIDDIYDAYGCEPLNYPGTPDDFQGNTYSLWCEPREALQLANTIADISWSIIAFLFFWALIFTTLQRNWAWGPGRIAVAKSPNRPRVTYPPPSPFTHIHETRRLYVWVLLIAFVVCLVWDFTLSIIMHQERITVNYTFGNNTVLQRGWPQKNNAYRLALTFLTIAFALIELMNLATWKRRWVAYTFGLLLFAAGCAGFVVFAMDVSDINHAKKNTPCPQPTNLVINLLHEGNRPNEVYNLPKKSGQKVFGCPHWEYAAVAFLDFWLAFILVVWAFIEFFIRSNFSWSTFYFYADSEWLRNHSLFVESTDREAYDWKRFTMETGRDYYYSPSLGISTVGRPRNYIEPDVPLF